MAYKILCKDIDGLKWYDEELESWDLLDAPETEVTFQTFGSDQFTSDAGLKTNYDVLIYDPDDIVTGVTMNFTPKKQTVTYSISSNIVVDDIIYDYEAIPGLYNIEFEIDRVHTNNEWVYNITTTLEKLAVTDRICAVYSINATS